jgi:hypothetical protein
MSLRNVGKLLRLQSITSTRQFSFSLRLWVTQELLLHDVNSGVQHPVARVSIRFINVTTVRN